MTSNNQVRFAVNCGRVLLALALLTLTGAWATQVAEQPIWGMSQQHFFNDSISRVVNVNGCMGDSGRRVAHFGNEPAALLQRFHRPVAFGYRRVLGRALSRKGYLRTIREVA